MKNYPRGIFTAVVVSLRKKENRFFLILDLYDDKCSRISIDLHDSICETLGTANIPHNLKERIIRCFPDTIKVSNINGYWEIQNESQLLSDVISRAL